MKFYKRDPDRALAGTAELTLKQRGAYNSLLDLLYSRDGEVPDDDRRVAKMISCHWREWATIKPELIAAGKIWVEGGFLQAKRVQETIKEAADFAQDQSKRAAKGWQKRKKVNNINNRVVPNGNALTAIATPIDTEAKASSGKEPPTDDLKAVIFGKGLEWLGKHTGREEKNLRPIIGRWCAAHGDGRTLEAMREAQRDSPVDPIGYIEKILDKFKGLNGHKPIDWQEALRRGEQ